MQQKRQAPRLKRFLQRAVNRVLVELLWVCTAPENYVVVVRRLTGGGGESRRGRGQLAHYTI